MRSTGAWRRAAQHGMMPGSAASPRQMQPSSAAQAATVWQTSGLGLKPSGLAESHPPQQCGMALPASRSLPRPTGNSCSVSVPPGSSVTLHTEGLWLHAAEDWLGASPDAIVSVTLPGQAPAFHLVEIKCPHSRRPADFQQLPQHIETQVLTQLAVISSHNLPQFQNPRAAVFIWFVDQAPITHSVEWARGGQWHWHGSVFPRLQRCWKQEWGPALRPSEHQSVVPVTQQLPQLTDSQQRQIAEDLSASDSDDADAHAAVDAERRLTAGSPATSDAQRLAAARKAAASLASLLPPQALMVGSRVQNIKSSSFGTITAAEQAGFLVAWDGKAGQRVARV